jgi:hypothetical protein
MKLLWLYTPVGRAAVPQALYYTTVHDLSGLPARSAHRRLKNLKREDLCQNRTIFSHRL